MMRVTIVTETYFPQVNGVSRTLGELVRHLTESGDQVQLIHPDYGPAAGHDARAHRVRSAILPFYKELYLPLPPFGSVHRAIASFAPELIHIATEATLGLSVLRFAMRKRLPVVSSFHTNFDQYSTHYRVGWARGAIWRYLRWFHNRTRETYVPSLATIHELERLGFERLVLWKRGVDCALFRPDRAGRLQVRRALGWAPEDVVIGYVSRIAAEKNVDHLAAALAIVTSRRPEVRVLFVGDGPSRPALERRLGSVARFVGYRKGEDLADHYGAADLFAFTSLTETFGNVVLEAMASGLPVVALRAGGVGETVQSGTTGLLAEPSEPPQRLADALLSLIDQPDQRQRMAAAARLYALSQSWDAIMGGLRRRYQDLLDAQPGRLAADRSGR
ncbi:MAG TPA: glycosyltransferase family 1 protein [Isosphaeraceae bacterium]|nr:glycosyltransferase family 1 protein [Isosphaeraceae bacterium]